MTHQLWLPWTCWVDSSSECEDPGCTDTSTVPLLLLWRKRVFNVDRRGSVLVDKEHNLLSLWWPSCVGEHMKDSFNDGMRTQVWAGSWTASTRRGSGAGAEREASLRAHTCTEKVSGLKMFPDQNAASGVHREVLDNHHKTSFYFLLLL